MKITKDMVDKFNAQMEKENSIIRLQLVENVNPQCEISLPSMKYVSSFIINPTKEFYTTLESFFGAFNITLHYNNTGSIFWSDSGWNEIIENLQTKQA